MGTMPSLRELFRSGNGPSSSHTMGPARAARIFRDRNPRASSFRVELAGSLAATGRGHLTDTVIISTLASPVEIVWSPDLVLPGHPNGMRFWAFDAAGTELDFWEVCSIGGGALSSDADEPARPEPYPFSTMREALELCEAEGIPLWQLAFRQEGDIREYLSECWSVMSKAVARGLETEGSLPGSLKLVRKASSYIIRARRSSGVEKRISTIFAYALAVAEENAAGGVVVTAPTCGSCGVLPAVLRILMEDENLGEERIVRAMATAGLVGNLVKTNASISGAEVGCQGEIGTACAMAAAAAAQLLGATPRQIEYAAEMGLEHHLGLTCDPIDGLVQIPCIERNAMAASRALDCAIYALLSDGSHRVSFDMVVKTMYETGRDLRSDYRETSRGGLAIHC
jgi:L-serine dehydratase